MDKGRCARAVWTTRKQRRRYKDESGPRRMADVHGHPELYKYLSSGINLFLTKLRTCGRIIRAREQAYQVWGPKRGGNVPILPKAGNGDATARERCYTLKNTHPNRYP
jgi:hypothetical protein